MPPPTTAKHPDIVTLIDDDPDFREFVRIVLESRGYQVTEADNAVDGLALLDVTRPRLILLDAMMSYELAGIGILRTLRSRPHLADTPVILISAVLNDMESRFWPADERNMVDRFLTKPISPDDLLAEVAALIGQTP